MCLGSWGTCLAPRWPGGPSLQMPTPQDGVTTPFGSPVAARPGQVISREGHRKKECLNLTNKATMLLKTKDRENEQSQTNPI